MAPKGLKIGDVFEEQGRYGVIRNRVIGFDGQGNYVAEMITDEKEVVSVEEFIQEELPFTIPDDEIDEVQPVVEEKKPAPKKTTTRKKTTAKKTSKK